MKQKTPFKIGDKVTSNFFSDELETIRTVTRVVKSSIYGTGYGVSSDGGKLCGECKRSLSKPITNVDSGWFTKIKGGE